MKRYDIHEDVLFEMHPGYNGEAMVRNPEGRYVQYEDVVAMLNKIADRHDESPRAAVIAAVFEEMVDVSLDDDKMIEEVLTRG
jgi:hypothetical protein